jgi:hypothetical protein
MVAMGAISAIPGLPALAGALETQGPADADTAATDVEATATQGEPVVAHVRDLATGEIGLFSGAREITVLDPQLAARLIKAAQ